MIVQRVVVVEGSGAAGLKGGKVMADCCMTEDGYESKRR